MKMTSVVCLALVLMGTAGCQKQYVRQQKVALCEQPSRQSNEVRDYIQWGYDQAQALVNCNIEIQKANSERGNS